MPCFSRCTRVTDVRVNRDVWVFHIPSRTSHAQSTRRSRPMCSMNCRVHRKLAWQLPAESALAFPPVASPSACPLPSDGIREARAAVTCRGPPRGPWTLRHTRAGPGLPRTPRRRPSVRSGKKEGTNFPPNGHKTSNAFRPRRLNAEPRVAAAHADDRQESQRSCPAGSRAGRGESLDEDAGCHLPVGEDRRAPRGGDEATGRHGRW